MIFNSVEFLIFFVVVFELYWFALKEKTKLQNWLLLISSYFFYAYANWKILPLLIVSTGVFYGLGLAVFQAKTDNQKSLLTTFGVVFGLGVLFYFKYANFFIDSFRDLFENIGLHTNWHTFKIIVPVGISFYTFRLLSYIIDIYRGRYEPTRDVIAFSSYVAFFPSILSGPIDRPNLLIPQLQKKRIFDYNLAVDGCRQILWGLFKKIVIADRCAVYVNQVWDSYSTDQSGITLVLAAILYSFQLYADFSGYSDMAIGIGKLLGLRMTQNFNYPYFAQNIADFWRRWHISLTSWLTDYVFIPLNVKWRNLGNWGMILAIIVNFVLCGLWHGANWTFILFGLYNGLLFIPLILSGKMQKKIKIETYNWGFPKIKTLGGILLTFGLVTAGLIVLRAENVKQAMEYLLRIADKNLISIPTINIKIALQNIFFIIIMLVIEWVQINKQHGLEKFGYTWNPIFRYIFYYALIVLIFLFSGEKQQFIYFQF